ncbi:glycoside hydrolase family 3 N-terminal domain-containing protein [Gilvibacter sp.]|uniref:glycoside hydrolase family 3 protein n=1 Tax=Gilvibacter sp. TaxID=2729997 RepID=UPI003F4A78A5
MKATLYISIAVILLSSCQPKTVNKLDLLVARTSEVIVKIDGNEFRDLNSNGKLDLYEDSKSNVEDRIEDLLSQMTLEEKAGMMFINGAPVSEDGDPNQPGSGPAARMMTTPASLDSLKMNHFNIWSIPDDPAVFAKWYNKVQLIAEKNRLGIPVTIASDPRHHLGKNVIQMAANGFSQFCELPGFAALNDVQLVREFADVVRKEYMAIGIREALFPQIDLATEPRWARISGNFSEDAELTARLVKPYIEGLQTTSLSNGIACMTKHFPGGGPQKEGLDPHFSIQKGQIYPGDNFDYHLIPFEAAFEANTSAIMPYYGIPVGQTDEDVAMSYNKAIITSLLREKYQYDGVVCTDWGLITDLPMGPEIVWKARAWGVEHLSDLERVEKIINAGVDQFGGESRPELVVQLVKEGRINEERLNASVRRLLRQKFQLGLFENPFVDESKVAETLQDPKSIALGERSQKESMTLLKNKENTLPLKKETKVYIENIDSTTVADYATIVSSPAEADFAIIRLNTPWYPADSKVPFARSFHHGDLDFKGEEKSRILDLLNKVPTVVDIYLDRPAVIPEITNAATALIANYGASDKSVCEVLFGNTSPQGKLPFELPSSMEAVRNQKTDVPYDSENPLFKFGFGLTYDID